MAFWATMLKINSGEAMNLVNIANKKHTIYLFQRTNRKKFYTTDNNFLPYYYEPSANGKFTGIYGDKTFRKVFVSEPNIIKKQRSKDSWESDILYRDRYFIDKIDSIEKTEFKYSFIDIEVKAKDFPKPEDAKYPVSCVTVYNSFDNNKVNFFLPNYKNEKDLLLNLALYLKREDFDLFLGWNIINFDWEYISNRWRKHFRSYFPAFISPINSVYFQNKLFVPSGSAIMDYMEMYKKIFPHGIKSYALDYILEYEFGAGKKHPIEDFSIINEELRLHNIEDVGGLAKIERKHHLLDFYDDIRRFVKCDWGNTLYNSRMMDIMLLRQAKEDRMVLPNRGKKVDETFRGAYRKSIQGYYK